MLSMWETWETLGRLSPVKDCTVWQADRENWWFPTLGLFVRFRQTEKNKKNRVWSQEVVSITHPLRPLYQLKCSPCPLVPWSSVHTLLYQCELVKQNLTVGEGIPFKELVTEMIKGRKKQKGQNGGVWDNPGVIKGMKLFLLPGLEDLWRRCLHQEGPPSRAEPRSPAAVRVGTTEHVSTL